MPKFGQIWFNGYYFSTDVPPWVDFRKCIGRVELGLSVRGSIDDRVTFRLRRNNGVVGGTAGELIQDKYKYFVPSSINNPESASARAALTTAVSNWKNVLTVEQKAAYNARANKKRFLSGYNLYIGEYVKANT